MQDSTTINDLLDQLATELIPIYTTKSPDPATGRPDCPLKKQHKQGKQYMFKAHVLEIIKRYDQAAKDGTE